MTKLLRDTIARLQQMPDERQDELARLVLREMEEDEKWLRSTEANAARLDVLIAEVLEANRRGEFEPLDPKQL